MDREQIVRDDFPTARKGWSPDAVRAHLIAVAESLPDPQARPTPAASSTSDRVQSVIAAAEAASAEIVSDAQAEADRTLGAAQAEAEQIRAAARAESEQKVTAADREATGRVEQARGAVEGLIAQADKLRAQVGALGRDLAANVPGSSVEATPGASASPESAEPIGAEPLVVPEAAPEPVRMPEPAAAPSDDDLISQLRGKPAAAVKDEPVETEPPAPAISGSDLGAARLVAMNMALDGASRDKIAKQISSEFGDVPNVDILLDDVLRRASR